MIEFDANGLYENAYGGKTFKRYARFTLDGKEAVGGVYIGQSTDTELLVELYKFAGRGVDEQYTDVVVVGDKWEATGQLITVPMKDVIKVFEPPRRFE